MSSRMDNCAQTSPFQAPEIVAKSYTFALLSADIRSELLPNVLFVFVPFFLPRTQLSVYGLHYSRNPLFLSK